MISTDFRRDLSLPKKYQGISLGRINPRDYKAQYIEPNKIYPLATQPDGFYLQYL